MGKTKKTVVIGPRTRRNFLFLYRLLDTKSPKQRWAMIQGCNKDELLSIIDVCTNVRRKSFKLSAKERRRIERHESALNRLSRVRSEKSAKKWIQTGEGVVHNPQARRKRETYKIVQRGGMLPAILAPVLTELAAQLIDHIIPDPPEDYMVGSFIFNLYYLFLIFFRSKHVYVVSVGTTRDGSRHEACTSATSNYGRKTL